jgi:hypothetical protein
MEWSSPARSLTTGRQVRRRANVTGWQQDDRMSNVPIISVIWVLYMAGYT